MWLRSSTSYVENYLAQLDWSAEATDKEKTLVAGNVRAFASHFRQRLVSARCSGFQEPIDQTAATPIDIVKVAASLRKSLDLPAGGSGERQIRGALFSVVTRCAEIDDRREGRCSSEQAAAVARLIAKSVRREFGLLATEQRKMRNFYTGKPGHIGVHDWTPECADVVPYCQETTPKSDSSTNSTPHHNPSSDKVVGCQTFSD
jgi:hypothetical protein